MTTTKDLNFNGYTSVLLRYANGEQALWVEDSYLAEKSDTTGTFLICDVNTSVPLDADENLDEVIADWKSAVEWDSNDA